MFIFEDKNNDYLNQEVDLRLSELTSQGLIKSEEEYKRVIQNTLNSIDADLQRITDVKKYAVKSDETISSKQLNELFTDLESDVRILHKEISDIHHVIDLTFDRNRLFYRRIKNRIAAIWKEIQHFRENTFNIEASNYTFFESFSENSVMHLSGLTIDKKTGTLVLAPGYINSFSDSSDIASIDMSLYPAANKDGGVIDTTNIKNTFDYNYSSGDHTLLKDGLWKVQMLTADIPEIILDIFGRGMNRTYRGIVTNIEITFTSQKIINEINVDPYGDFSTKVIGVRYQVDETSTEWLDVVDENGVTVTSSDVDWIVLRNFAPISAKKLRIYFYQPNYQIISRLLNSVDSMVDKMVKALIEQRFEKVNYKYKSKDQFPKWDTSEEADLYDEIMKIIDEGGDISTLESQITNLLVPQPIDISADIRNWKLFNLGAWSIDPRNVAYSPQSTGVYISHDPRDHTSGFKVTNGVPSYVKLYTQQSEPSTTSIEWSLLVDTDNVNYKEIPIIPNNDIWRNETAKYNEHLNLKYYSRAARQVVNHKNMYNVFKLDFPIHPAYIASIVITENGLPLAASNYRYFEFYNSTELYVPNADLTNNGIYTIKYIPAMLDTVKCWTIIPNTLPRAGQVDIGTMCVFATKQAAINMVNLLKQSITIANKPKNVVVSKGYTIVSQLCTVKEYNFWFLNGTVNTFIDSALDNDNDRNNQISWFATNDKNFKYNMSDTRVTWLFRTNVFITQKVTPYSENGYDEYTWKELPAAVPSVKIKEIQH